MTTFRPLSDWLLVQYDPPQKKSDIIEVVGGNESSIRTGVVISVGPGKPLENGKESPVFVKEGDRIAFLRWHDEHRPGKAIAKALQDMNMDVKDTVMLIRQSDILLVLEDDVRVDVA